MSYKVHSKVQCYMWRMTIENNVINDIVKKTRQSVDASVFVTCSDILNTVFNEVWNKVGEEIKRSVEYD